MAAETYPALQPSAASPRSNGAGPALTVVEEAPAETDEIARAALAVARARARVPARRSTLVAISGIDASGKGVVTQRLRAALCDRGVAAVALHADEWLNLPERRFSRVEPARHFYRHPFRFDEMFQRLVVPLTYARRCHVVADVVHETATEFRHRTYDFEDVDVVLLESIFLLKPAHRALYDLSIWVECTFETALERAIERRQEGCSLTETIRAYETIYFPAQQLHLELDDPRSAATLILENDARLQRLHRR